MVGNSCAISLPEIYGAITGFPTLDAGSDEYQAQETKTMAAQLVKHRNAVQTLRQLEVRNKAWKTRRPSYDDIARLPICPTNVSRAAHKKDQIVSYKRCRCVR